MPSVVGMFSPAIGGNDIVHLPRIGRPGRPLPRTPRKKICAGVLPFAITSTDTRPGEQHRPEACIHDASGSGLVALAARRRKGPA